MSVQATDCRIQALPLSLAFCHEMRNPFHAELPNIKCPAASSLNLHNKPQIKTIITQILPKALESERDVCESEVDSLDDTTTAKTTSDPSSPVSNESSSTDKATAPYIALHIDEIFKSFITISQLALPSKDEINERKVGFIQSPKESGKISLLLDLDETLIHVLSNSSPCMSRETSMRVRKLEVEENGSIVVYKYLLRPGLYRFLSTLTQKFDISVKFLEFLNFLRYSQLARKNTLLPLLIA